MKSKNNYDKINFIPKLQAEEYLSNVNLEENLKEEFVEWFDFKCRAGCQLNTKWFKLYQDNNRKNSQKIINYFFFKWLVFKGLVNNENRND